MEYNLSSEFVFLLNMMM